MMIELFAQQFHWYGFIVGIAVVVVWLLMEHLVEKDDWQKLLPIWFVVMATALVGARLWHIMTDWSLYSQYSGWELVGQVMAVWQGGLSILGAMGGGLLGLVIAWRWGWIPTRSVLLGLDSAAIALPFGQAVGRVANYINQELYGLPTQLPWAIFIDRAHRVAGFENAEWFHPLFAYEAGLLIIFGVGLYVLHRQNRIAWGTGQLFGWYLLYYAVIRWGLDFLRVDKVMFNHFLSWNQVILLGVIVIVSSYQLYRWWYEKK